MRYVPVNNNIPRIFFGILLLIQRSLNKLNEFQELELRDQRITYGSCGTISLGCGIVNTLYFLSLEFFLVY